MNYTKHDKTTEIVTVKEELNLEFEELEFEELECEDNKPEEFETKVTELLGLQTIPADTDASKVSTCQNDQESSQIIIKEEIDCDTDNGSVSGLDPLHFADKVAGTTLRRSSRRRCLRFSVGDLLESASNETSVSKHNKKVQIQSSSHCICEKRLSTARGAQLPKGRSKSSDRCEVCGKSFEHFCDVCSRRFSRIEYLRRHAATHYRSKLYPCGQCGKFFKRSDNLKEHERLHSGEKYRCAECGREFSQRGQMSKHARTHMRMHMCTHMCTHAVEQQFHCADCGKVFRWQASLCDHVRIHTGERPFHCADCGKAFRTRQFLRDHVRVHMDERPFSCRLCGKAFRQASSLRGHARLHTGERRYGCDVCGRLFFRRTHLKVHRCRLRQRKLQP